METYSVRHPRLYDFQLSAATPLYADSNHFLRETPLEIEVHAGAEVGVLLAGSEEHQLEGWVRRLVPGDVWLTATWEPHGWRVAAPDTEDVLVIFLPQFLGEEQLGSLSWLDLFAVPPARRPRVTSPEMRQRVVALGHELRQEIAERRPGWESAARLNVLSLLLTLSREWEPPDRTHPGARARATNLPRVMPALSLVQSWRDRRVRITEAAQACGLSRAQFCVIFRSTMGISFGKFCLRSRLGAVAELLLTTDLPTDAIAEQTGFTDSSHLHHSFVKQYGCTPGRYRTENRPRGDGIREPQGGAIRPGQRGPARRPHRISRASGKGYPERRRRAAR